MQFKLALIAVADVEKSKAFYGDLFEQQVALDLGWNVMFSGGFAIQQNFAWLTDLPPESVVTQAHNMELYFEVDDFDAFLEKLSQEHREKLRAAGPGRILVSWNWAAFCYNFPWFFCRKMFLLGALFSLPPLAAHVAVPWAGNAALVISLVFPAFATTGTCATP